MQPDNASRPAGQLLSRAWPWLAGGVALTLANAWLVSFDLSQYDEAWTLHVASRVASGEALYGDVWFGTTPLSIYLLVGAISLLGEQIVVVKALEAILAAGCGLLVARIGLLGGLSGYGAALLALLTISLSPALAISLYTPLAMLFLLACESVVLGARGRLTVRTAVLAGALAGLAFASKHNIGSLALLALGGTIVLTDRSRTGLRRMAVALGAFGAIAVASLASMIATGGIANTEDALIGKSEYMRYASVSYMEMLARHFRTAVRPEIWLAQLRGDDRDLFVGSPKVFLPVATAVLLSIAWLAWWRRRGRRGALEPTLVAISLFAGAAFAGAYPLFDTYHLAWVAGPMLAACGVSLTFLPPIRLPAVRAAVTVVALAWVGFYLAGPLSDWRADPVRMGLPHTAGIWTPPTTRAQAEQGARRLEEAVPGGRVFIVASNASFYFLIGDLRNPTRHDFPVQTVITPEHTREILEGVADGSVTASCIPDGRWQNRPVELVAKLYRASRRGPDVGLCRIWFASPSD